MACRGKPNPKLTYSKRISIADYGGGGGCGKL